MTLKEFRVLLETNESEAIKLWNDLFKEGLDVNEASKRMGFSWGAVRPEIYALGYNKPKNKLICKENEQGERIMVNKENNKLTEEEILFIKELYRNKSLETSEDFKITCYDDYKQRSMLISEGLLKKLDDVYTNNKMFKKQDIFNTILELGLDTYFKNLNN